MGLEGLLRVVVLEYRYHYHDGHDDDHDCSLILMIQIYGHHEEYNHKKAEVGWRRKVCCESWVWIIIGTLPTSAFLLRPDGHDDDYDCNDNDDQQMVMMILRLAMI